jgi:type I restriction enzyme R subunit
MRITGDDKDGKAQLGNFIDNDEPFPVIVTTSRLLSTGVDAKTCKLIVLDQTINSMTQFKQVIGRGTRLREDYQKLYFTIMDFKGATRLFQDKDFDGEPAVVYEPGPDEPVLPPEGDVKTDPDDIPDGPRDKDPQPQPNPPTGRRKFVLSDVEARTAIERSQYLDVHGQLITEDYRVLLRTEIKRTIQTRYASLKDFLNHWIEAGRKQAVLDELKDAGIPLEALQQAVPDAADLDVFDLVAHIAYDQKPLTRKERADRVRKRNYFAKYGDQARAVLEALLEKYADHGIADIEDPNVLELPPFRDLGTKTQIRRGIFGSNERYSLALTELERALYDPADK